MLLRVSAAVASVALLGWLAAQVKDFVKKAADAFGRLIDSTESLGKQALHACWAAVRPVQAPDPLPVVLGLGLLGAAAIVVRANYHQLVPTVAFLIPVEGAQTALALAIAVMGAVTGCLFEAIPRYRALFAAVASMLIVCVGVLNWQRALIVLDEPGLADLLLATAVPVLLQVAELVAVFGALYLAGPVLPVIASLPVLVGVGVVAASLHLLRRMGLQDVMAALLDATIGIAECLFLAIVRLARWLSRAGFAERSHKLLLLQAARSAEVDHNRSNIDLDLERARVQCESDQHQIRAEASHRRLIVDLQQRLAFEAFEAQLRAEYTTDSQVLADWRSRRVASGMEINTHYHEVATRIAINAFDEVSPQAKDNAVRLMIADLPEAAANIAAAARKVFRGVGAFLRGDSPGSRPAGPDPVNGFSDNQTVN